MPCDYKRNNQTTSGFGGDGATSWLIGGLIVAGVFVGYKIYQSKKEEEEIPPMPDVTPAPEPETETVKPEEAAAKDKVDQKMQNGEKTTPKELTKANEAIKKEAKQNATEAVKGSFGFGWR